MKFRVLAKYVKLTRHSPLHPGGEVVRYVRGDVFDGDDHNLAAVCGLCDTYCPTDGSEALGRLIQDDAGKIEDESPKRKRSKVEEYKEPAWFRRQVIPAIEPVG